MTTRGAEDGNQAAAFLIQQFSPGYVQSVHPWQRRGCPAASEEPLTFSLERSILPNDFLGPSFSLQRVRIFPGISGYTAPVQRTLQHGFHRNRILQFEPTRSNMRSTA